MFQSRRTLFGYGLIIIFLLCCCALKFGVIPPISGLKLEANILIFVVGVVATLWIGELMPIGFASLSPIVLLPMFSIISAKAAAGAYLSSVVFLLVGGFMMSQALERHGVPDFIGDRIKGLAGQSLVRQMGLITITTCVLSMWISNTATALIMVTVATSMLSYVTGGSAEERNKLKIAYLLCIAYSANLGGMMTPVGTAPNAIMMGLLEKTPSASPIPFAAWMAYGLPLLPLSAVFVFYLLHDIKLDAFSIKATHEKHMTLSINGRRTMWVFAFVSILWLTRKTIRIGGMTIWGWSDVLDLSTMVDDGFVAVLGVLLMALVPRAQSAEEATYSAKNDMGLLSWDDALKIPWGLMLLFGGGLALAKAFGDTGLSRWIGASIQDWSSLPDIVLVLMITGLLSFLTEVTSNTATATLILPLVLTLGVGLGLDPLLLAWPATMAVSAAFMLPVATPPNAIVAGYGNIPTGLMARKGLVLNCLSVVYISFLAWVYFS